MKLASVEIFYIMAIYLNRTTVYIIETHKQLNHGGFSCTGRPYNRNFLTIFDLCRKIVDNDLFRIVTEAYMIKFYISAEPVNRNSKVTDVLEEGLNITYFNRTFDREPSSKKGYHNISKVSNKLHDRHHDSGEKLGFPC